MKKIADFFFPVSWQKMLYQSLSYSAIATAGLVASALIVSGKVNAQTPQPLNSDQINNYAQAVLAMEPARQQAFDEIKKIIGGSEIPKIVCSDSKSISTLPKKAQDIAVTYCNRSQKIVEDNGLTIEVFNKITVALQSDDNLKRLIYNRLIFLQKPAESR